MHEPVFYRGRRLRRTPALRDMIRETRLGAADLIMPYFVAETDDASFAREIGAMPGQYQLAPEALLRRLEPAVDKGLRAVLLFGIPREKDPAGSGAWAEKGVVQGAIRLIKSHWPELCVITDVCLCEYTSHGHCGLLKADDTSGEVLNDPTLELLARTALSHVEAGADIVAPSDMMDGRVLAIRTALDKAGHSQIPIMSYAVKYASSYYGPFREAAESAPKFGDRKTYQMDPGNPWEALREAKADIVEGADILMVKPAGPYQDIIRLLADAVDLPLAAYQVSGEYALIRAAGRAGWVNEEAVILESLLGIRRAGAKLLISYFAEELLCKGLVR